MSKLPLAYENPVWIGTEADLEKRKAAYTFAHLAMEERKSKTLRHSAACWCWGLQVGKQGNVRPILMNPSRVYTWARLVESPAQASRLKYAHASRKVIER